MGETLFFVSKNPFESKIEFVSATATEVGVEDECEMNLKLINHIVLLVVNSRIDAHCPYEYRKPLLSLSLATTQFFRLKILSTRVNMWRSIHKCTAHIHIYCSSESNVHLI